MKTLAKLRRSYHDKISTQIVRISKKDGQPYPNFADGSSQSSVLIANGIVKALGFPTRKGPSITGQTAGTLFEKLTCEFLQDAFTAIRHLRPGRWQYLTASTQISNFVQYQHLETLDSLVSDNQTLSAALGHGYIVTPDIVIARHPATQDEVNVSQIFLDDSGMASLTPFLEGNQPTSVPFLHASISCK